MPKINLDLNADRVYGKYLPAVYIDRIIVNHPRTDEITDTSQISFDVHLTINFTFEGKDNTFENIKSWIETNLDRLYLYSWVSPYSKVNQDLEDKKLNLMDLFFIPGGIDESTFNRESPIYDDLIGEMKEAFARKYIDYFEEGLPTTGGEEAIATAYPTSADRSADGLKTLYYYSNYNDLMTSLNTDNSMMQKLFYGVVDGDVNFDGPWNADGTDIPNNVYYRLDIGELTGLDSDYVYYSDNYYTESWFDSHGFLDGDELTIDIESVGSDDGKFKTDGVPLKGGYRESFVKRNLADFITRHVTHEDSASILTRKVKLTELLGDGETGMLSKREVYDENGNELIQITDIVLTFLYAHGKSGASESLKTIPNLLSISTIGLDDVNFRDPGETGHPSTDSPYGTEFGAVVEGMGTYYGFSGDAAPRSMFNNYYGGITYETILKYGEVDKSFEEMLVEAKTGVPYDGTPVQALNGKYYAEEPLSRRDVIDSFGKIIKKYKTEHAFDEVLLQNIKNLQYILSVFKDSIEFFSELKRFQTVYTPKSKATASGRFYSEIIAKMVEFSKKIMLQTEVRKKLVLNTTVIDIRDTKFLTDSVTFPSPREAYTRGNFEFNPDPLRSTRLETASDSFIPRSWMELSRRSLTTYSYADEYSELDDWLTDDYDEIFDDIVDAGARGSDAEILTEYMFHEGLRSDLYRDAKGHGRQEDADYICENNGFFFFDWEKALHTQSNIAQLCPLSRLQRFLGLRVPYKYFQVKTVRMLRKEPDFVVTDGEMEAADLSTINYHGVDQILHLNYSLYNGPQNNYTEYQIFDGSIDSTDTDAGEQALLTSEDTRGYGYPYPKTTKSDRVSRQPAYIKLVNFDVANASESLRLEGFNDFSATSYGAGSTLADTIARGAKVRQGYRLMCFEFRDYMDDDLAYYNTRTAGTSFYSDPEREDALQALNPSGAPCSAYSIQIIVKDKTIEFFINTVYKLLKDAYDDLKEYVDYAENYCSYNNITGVFNQYFIDGVLDVYESTDEKPWVKAAFLINTCRQIFFKEFDAIGGVEIEQKIIDESIAMVNKFAPDTGTLEGLQSFAAEYKRFLMQFNPNLDDSIDLLGGEPPTPLIYNRIVNDLAFPPLEEDMDMIDPEDFSAVSYNLTRDFEFANYLNINQPIYGDFSLAAYGEDDISAADIGFDISDTPILFTFLPAGAAPTGTAPGSSTRVLEGDTGLRFIGEMCNATFHDGVTGMHEDMFVGATRATVSSIIDYLWQRLDFEYEAGYMAGIADSDERYDVTDHQILPIWQFYNTDAPHLNYATQSRIARSGTGGPSSLLGAPHGTPKLRLGIALDIMMCLAANMAGGGYIGHSVAKFKGDYGADTFAESFTARKNYISLEHSAVDNHAMKSMGNITGLTAQALLYVIRNEIYPLVDRRPIDGSTNRGTGTIDDGMHMLSTGGDGGDLEDALFTVDGADAILGALPADLVASDDDIIFDATSDGDTIYDTKDHTGYSVARILMRDDAYRYFIGGHTESYRRNLERYERLRKYYLFRNGLKLLHNALLDICYGFSGDIMDYTDVGRDWWEPGDEPDHIMDAPLSDGGKRTSNEWEPYRYAIAATVRSYLDRDNPIGLDWNNLRSGGTFDEDPSRYELYDDYDDVWADTAFIGSGDAIKSYFTDFTD